MFYKEYREYVYIKVSKTKVFGTFFMTKIRNKKSGKFNAFKSSYFLIKRIKIKTYIRYVFDTKITKNQEEKKC